MVVGSDQFDTVLIDQHWFFRVVRCWWVPTLDCLCVIMRILCVTVCIRVLHSLYTVL